MLAVSTENIQGALRDVGGPPPLQIHDHNPAVEIRRIRRHAHIAVVRNREVSAQVFAATGIVRKHRSTIDPGATQIGHGEASRVSHRLGPECRQVFEYQQVGVEVDYPAQFRREQARREESRIGCRRKVVGDR